MAKLKNRRGTFTETFKRQTARRAHRAKANPNGERLIAIARDVGVTPNTITSWMERYPPGTPADPETTVYSGGDGAIEHKPGNATPSTPSMSSIRIKGLDDFIRQELRGDTLRAIVREELTAMFGSKAGS